jgi:hypothetical protein
VLSSQLIITVRKVFHEGASSSGAINTTHHHVVFSRKGHRPSVHQSQLIIIANFRARPSVLSITTHHHVVFSMKGTSLRYQSQLIITLCFHERHVPYQSQHIIMLCFNERHRPSASITTHHHVVFSMKGTSLRAINHNSSCRFSRRHVLRYQSQLIIIASFHEKARPSVLSITTHHHVVFSRKGHVPPVQSHIINVVFSRKARPPCYQSQLTITLFTKGTSSVNTVTTHHVVFSRKYRRSPCINHNSSSKFYEARPSVLSITTHHHVVFSRKARPSINHNSSSRSFSRVSTSLRAINHNSSSLGFFTERHRPSVLSITTHHVVFSSTSPPCYQSQLIIMLFSRKHVPPCYQSQLIIS